MTEPPDDSDEPRSGDHGAKLVVACVGGWGLASALLAAVVYGGAVAGSVAVGALLATLNLVAFFLIGRGLLGGGARAGMWALAGFSKFVVLIAAGYALLASGRVQPLPLAIGYLSLPAGIVFATLISAVRGAGPPRPPSPPEGPSGSPRSLF
ncbi:MAG: hypothetical protein AAGA56_22145 [Myxococcota bacterium]